MKCVLKKRLWLNIIFLSALIPSICGQSEKERFFQCYQSRLVGQTDCSPQAEFYVFNKDPKHRRCEHVNGRCYQFRTVFKTARDCEIMCRPYIMTKSVGRTPSPIATTKSAAAITTPKSTDFEVIT
ncbi:uncharacterized protein LOC115627480 [Scaptodrosophila lebanonensis]|uniref:Uncharacterized protein LOC115627480 n=1 Tax=Drosophila lebanonensis TaxID=7225 RepID=A0A6J2TV37_DROLE|nr:uncharacterized protein LOC115627480 [Scaptodrosophila lebanonensis]